jgi:hypothetical protein
LLRFQNPRLRIFATTVPKLPVVEGDACASPTAIHWPGGWASRFTALSKQLCYPLISDAARTESVAYGFPTTFGKT